MARAFCERYRIVAASVLCLIASIPYFPAGAAQDVAPSSQLAVSVAPGPVSIALGGEHVVPVAVALAAANFACPQGGELLVTLIVKESPSALAGVMAHLVDSLAFPVPPGAYQTAASAASGAFNETVEAELRIMVAEDAPADHAHAFRVLAAFAGGTPPNCVSASPLPPADASAEHAIRIGPALAPPSPATAPPTSSTTPTAASPREERRAPTVGPLALALAAGALALLAKRPR